MEILSGELSGSSVPEIHSIDSSRICSQETSCDAHEVLLRYAGSTTCGSVTAFVTISWLAECDGVCCAVWRKEAAVQTRNCF